MILSNGCLKGVIDDEQSMFGLTGSVQQPFQGGCVQIDALLYNESLLKVKSKHQCYRQQPQKKYFYNMIDTL